MKLLLIALVLATSLPPHIADAKPRKKTLTQQVKEQVTDQAQMLTTAAPKDNETCFSPDEPCVYKLIKFIQSAQKTLDVAIFDITDKRVANALIDQQGKNVRVRMVLNKRTKDSTGAYQLLKDANILMRFGKQRGIMHDKLTIVDGKRVVTGSYNYSYGASRSNQENQLYLSTPSVVERYTQRFEKMWREGKSR